MKISINDKVLLVSLILIGFLFRTIFAIAPNVEFVTVASLAAGYFMHNKKLSLLVPLAIMILSDAVIGNTSIFLFTWSAFLITPLIGVVLSRDKPDSQIVYPALVGLGGSILSVIIFYLWTNFGVVITTTMYPDTLAGLMDSYVNALPFLKNQLYSNMIFAPMVFASIVAVKNYLENKSVVENRLENM